MSSRVCQRFAVITIIMLAAAVLPLRQAHGTISSASIATSGCTGSANNTDGSTTCESAIATNNGTNLNTRFGLNVNSDTGIFSTDDQSGAATHRISFNATATGGYRLDIGTTRTGDLNRISDAPGCDGNASLGAVTGTSNIVLNSGTLNIATAPSLGNGGSTTSSAFSHSSGTAQIFRVSNSVAQAHTLTFTWSASTRSNSCEAAVRNGADNGTTTGCTACVYPGSPSRTKSSDGHFVNVTFVNLCGNGVIDASVGEQCDQGGANGSGGSCCTLTCQFRASGETCRLAATSCDVAESCSGSSANCPADGFLPSGTLCRAGSAGEVCDENEFCNGTVNCPADQVKPFGTVCRASAGECDAVDNCDGVAKTCPADAKKPNGTACTSDGNPCSLDICNGSSNLCQHPAGNAGAVCRATAGVCDVAETCTGASTTCPPDAFLNFTNLCRPQNGGCDIQENCSGSSPNCPPDSPRLNGFVCRASAGVCDVSETCDGVNFACPADAKKPSGTACASDGNPCTLDQCDGSNNACQHPAGNSGALCRASGGECDIAETCDGSNTACPPDDKQPGGTPCTADSNVCTLDECDGSSNACQHPAGNAGVTCRAVSTGDLCDEEEQCDGLLTICPPDLVSLVGTECRAQNGICDVAEQCDGSSKQCPSNGVASNSTPCRNAAGVCDVTENCDGTNTTCPSDAFANSGQCRASAGVCDVAESCNGSGPNCPPDGKSTAPCRSSAGVCDVAESCDGSNDACPADGFANSGTCRGSAGICDIAESCDGSGPNCPTDAFEPTTTQCRADAGQCDVAENCTGSGAACPVDGFEPDGTTCNDGDVCTGGEECTGGVCGGGTSLCELDHYKCYQGKDLKNPKFVRTTISTSDQIITEPVEVKKLKFVCSPVDKNGEGINNPTTHLACYQLKAPTLSPRPSVEVSTQFQTSRFQLKKGKLICVPATKSILP